MRRIHSLANRQEAWLDVHNAEYQARCGCRRALRSWPVGVPPKSEYDDRVREAVERVLVEGPEVQRSHKAMRRDFGLKRSQGFLYDGLRYGVASLDMGPHPRMVLEKFLCTFPVEA